VIQISTLLDHEMGEIKAQKGMADTMEGAIMILRLKFSSLRASYILMSSWIGCNVKSL